jgi:hypothetical protein
VAALSAEPLDSGTEHFDPSNLEWTTFDVGNPATNVVPAEAKAAFNIRFNDSWSPDSLASAIRARVERAMAGATGVQVDLAFEPTNAVAFLTAPGPFVELVAAAIEAETGLRPALSTTGGTSDARFIKDHCPVVEFGLVGRTMHGIDECVAVEDLERLTAIYGRVLTDYLLRPDSPLAAMSAPAPAPWGRTRPVRGPGARGGRPRRSIARPPAPPFPPSSDLMVQKRSARRPRSGPRRPAARRPGGPASAG